MIVASLKIKKKNENWSAVIVNYRPYYYVLADVQQSNIQQLYRARRFSYLYDSEAVVVALILSRPNYAFLSRWMSVHPKWVTTF